MPQHTQVVQEPICILLVQTEIQCAFFGLLRSLSTLRFQRDSQDFTTAANIIEGEKNFEPQYSAFEKWSNNVLLLYTMSFHSSLFYNTCA